MANCSCTVDCGRQDGIYLCGLYRTLPGTREDSLDGGKISAEVVRSSGANGICDILYGKAFFGAVACKNNQPVLMPADIIAGTTVELQITPLGSNCEVYGSGYGDGFTVTGIPVTYSEFSNQFSTRFSASICGIETSGCCDSVGTCYSINAYLKGGPCIDKLDFLTTYQRCLVCDIRKKEVCETEVYIDGPLTLDPFADDGVNENIWIIAKEAVDTQKTIPIQNGISHDDSYIGLVRPVLSGIDPLP